MTVPPLSSLLAGLALTLTVWAGATVAAGARVQESPKEAAMLVQYLEIVTPDVDATCDALAALHDVSFSEPVSSLGNARTAAVRGGGRIGVRAPLRANEAPVVRPYVLVEDIEAAVKDAAAAGAEIALPRMELAGQGACAIYVLGGIEHGLWQL